VIPLRLYSFIIRRPPLPTLLPYTTLFRSGCYLLAKEAGLFADAAAIESCTLPIVPLFESIDGLRRAPEIMRELLQVPLVRRTVRDRKSTRLNSSHLVISYAVFCLKKKKI